MQPGREADEFDNQLNDPGQYDNPQDPASLSVVEHLRALSVRGKLVLLYVVGAITYVLLRFDLVSLSCLSLPASKPYRRVLHAYSMYIAEAS